jgi:hypothetical protein
MIQLTALKHGLYRTSVKYKYGANLHLFLPIPPLGRELLVAGRDKV